MNIIGIIPGRMGSSRFPGKPLAKICGIPMIEHVYRRSVMSGILNDVYIATCDQVIREAAESCGCNVIMTKDSHERATERTAEAAEKIEERIDSEIDIVVMIQGDEPMLFPEMIDDVVHPMLQDERIQVANLMAPLESLEEQRDPNEIKVVVDKDGFALYFSRMPIPTNKSNDGRTPMFKQVCIIPFRRDFLYKFNNLQQTSLEIAESVDMLRILEHGYKVKMIRAKHQTYSVDTPEDLKKVENLMLEDLVFQKYKSKILI